MTLLFLCTVAEQILAYCTNSPRVYFWNCVTGCSWSDIPATAHPFPVTTVQWSSDGSQLILAGKDSFCTCSLSIDDINYGSESSAMTFDE